MSKAWWAPYRPKPVVLPPAAAAARPSWQDCAAQGMTLREAAKARGCTPEAARRAEAAHGLRFRRERGEEPGVEEIGWRLCAYGELSLEEAARALGRSRRAAESAARRYGIRFRRDPPSVAVFSPDSIIRAGDSIVSVAEEAGVSPTTIRRRLAAAGVPARLIDAPPAGREHHRAVAEALPPREAIGYLLDVIEHLEGSGPTERAALVAHGFNRSEAAMLLRLIRARGAVVTHERLVAAAGLRGRDGDGPEPQAAAHVRVVWLRRKIARWPGARIETVHGEGYRLARNAGHRFPWERAAGPIHPDGG